MILLVLVVIYVLAFVLYVICGTAYLVLGERALRYVRSHYPAEWVMRGKPTFVSFTVLIPHWVRPFSARVFFVDREYRALRDSKLTRRGEIVRVLGLLKSGATISFPIIALLAYTIRFSWPGR